MGYWMQNEAGARRGIVGDNNPINVSQPGYGGVPIQYDGDGVTTCSPTRPCRTASRRSRVPEPRELPADPGRPEGGRRAVGDSSLASEISVYSGGGYSTIPDSWGASQGQPLT